MACLFMPAPCPVNGLFRTIGEIDRDWMPTMRLQVAEEKRRGKRVWRLDSVEDLDRLGNEW